MRALIPHLIYQEYQAGHLHGVFEAASLFMDISGFTRLTESLMQHGKDGADTLTKALNDLLEQVVHTVYQNQGFIAHFAGDGFVALFTGENKAIYAVQAAAAIQELFAQQGQTQTPYGTFQLAVRLGLGTGSASWHIVGTENRRVFYFQGEALKSCIAAQTEGQAGEIVAAPEFIAQVGEQVTFEQASGSAVMTSLQTVLPPQPLTLPDLPHDFLTLFGLRTVLNLSLQGEFRDVASIFIALGEPETETLEAVTRRVIDAADIYGGYLNKLEYADKGAVLLVVFGAPVAYENNVERAAHFLLALRGQNLPIKWTAGLTYGTVYAGLLGGAERSEYTVIGDAVNLASRLAHGMGAGEIWTDSQSADRLSGRGYQFEAAGQQGFKGRSDVQVHRLTGTQMIADANPEYPIALVGRAAELSRLEKAVAPILSGAFGGVAQVNGEIGMGKTRLIHELRQQLAGRVTWFTCRADEILHESLNPLRDFLMRYFDQTGSADKNQATFDAKIADLLRRLTAGGYDELTAELERRRASLAGLIYLKTADDQLEPELRFNNNLAAIKTLILAEARLQPLIFHLDKAHAIDSDSETFLKNLLHNVEGYPFIVLLTGNYDDYGRPYALPVEDVPLTAIDLRPLADDSIGQMVTTLLDGDVHADTATFFSQHADGNPLYVEELIALLKEKDALHEAPLWRIRTEEISFVPPSRKEIQIAILDRLPPEAKRIVQHAAVLESVFDADVLAAMVGRDVKPALQQAVDHNVLQAESTRRYRFAKDSMHTVAYEMQPRAERIRWHKRAGEAFEQVYASDLTPYYGRLIDHFRVGEEPERERLYLTRAADRDADAFANQTALAHLERALELAAGKDEDSYQLLLLRERIHDRLAERDAQQADLQQLSALGSKLGDARKQLTVTLREAQYAETQAAFDKVERLAGEAAARAQANQQAEQEIEACLLLGTSALQQGMFDAADQYFQRAVALAEEAHLPTRKPECLSGLGNVYLHQGTDYSRAADYFEQALALYRQLGDRLGESRMCNNLGTAAFRRGFLPNARDWFVQARDGFSAIGDRRNESRASINLGILVSMLGDYKAATQVFEKAIVVCREINERRGLGQAYMNLGNVNQYQGHYKDATENYKQALVVFNKIGDNHSQAMVANNLGLLCRYQGLFDDAERYYNEALQGFKAVEVESGLADVPFGLAMVAADVGDYETAQVRYQQALGHYGKIEDRQAESDVLGCFALLKHQMGDHVAAQRDGETALNISREIEDPSVQAYALTVLGHAYAALNQPEQAKANYSEALQLRLELEEAHLAAETRAGLARLALAENDLNGALAEVNSILEFLNENLLDGTTEPARIYLTCYKVLKAADDARAGEMLEAGCKLVNDRAASIADEQRRTLYRKIVTHTELLALCGAS